MASVAPKTRIVLSHLRCVLRLFNGGFDKLEESRIEASHQKRARDYHRTSRMKNVNNVEKFEAKLQNIRVNREVTRIQGEVFNFTRRRRAVETFSIK